MLRSLFVTAPTGLVLVSLTNPFSDASLSSESEFPVPNLKPSSCGQLVYSYHEASSLPMWTAASELLATSDHPSRGWLGRHKACHFGSLL